MKEFTSSVSPKGQITIPLEIRRQLGVKPKDRVAVRLEGGEVRVTPMPSRLDAIYQSVPALETPRSFREMREIAREDHVEEVAREGR